MPNQLVDWWRSQRPEDAGLSDEDLTLKIGDLAPEYQKQGTDLFATYPDFAADHQAIVNKAEAASRRAFSTTAGEVGRGLGRGLEGLRSTAYGLGAMAADGVGADPVRDFLVRKYKESNDAAGQEAYRPAVPTMSDVHGVGDAVSYLAGKVGEVAPSLAEAAITGVAGAVAGSEAPGVGNVAGAIGGVLARNAARRLIAKEIAGYTAEQIESAALKGIGSEALKALVKSEVRGIAAESGAVIANGLNSYGLSAGEIYGNLISDPNVNPDDAFGIAAIAAFPAAVADTAMPSYVLRKSGVFNRLTGVVGKFGETEQRGFMGYVTRLAAEIPKTAPMESGTEAFQELVGIAAQKYAKTKSFDLSLTPAEQQQIIEAGVGGAVGGVVAAPAAALHAGRSHTETGDETKTDAPAAPVAPVIPTPEMAGTDVLGPNYDIDPAGLRQMAERKVAGEDLSVEEATLKPPALRFYRQEVIALEEKRAQQKTEETAPSTPAAPVENPESAGPTPSDQTNNSVQMGTSLSDETNKTGPIGPVVLEKTDAAKPAGSVVDEAVPAADDAQALHLTHLESNVTNLQTELDAERKRSETLGTVLDTSESMLGQYDKDTLDAGLRADVEKRGGRDALVALIARTRQELTGDKAGRKGIARRLQTIEQQLARAKEILADRRKKPFTFDDAIRPSDVNTDAQVSESVDHTPDGSAVNGEVDPAHIAEHGFDPGTLVSNDQTEEADAKMQFPGYYDAEDKIDVSQALARLFKDYESADDSQKKVFGGNIGQILTTGGRAKTGGSSFSKRVTVWLGRDGDVMLTTSHRRTGEGLTPNQEYRFAVKNGSAKQEGALRGVIDMLNLGYRPWGSMLLRSEINQGFRKFESLASYKAEFGHLKSERGEVASGRSVLHDGQAEIVDTESPTIEETLTAAEIHDGEIVMGKITGQFAKEALAMIASGDISGVLQKTVAGQMISAYEAMAAAGKTEAQMSKELGVQFADAIHEAAALSGLVSPENIKNVIKALPLLIGQFYNRFKRSPLYEKTRSTESLASPKPEAAVRTDGDGGADSQGNRGVAQEGGESKPQASATPAGEAPVATAPDTGADVAREQMDLFAARREVSAAIDRLTSLGVARETTDRLELTASQADKAGLIGLQQEISNQEDQATVANDKRAAKKSELRAEITRLAQTGILESDAQIDLDADLSSARTIEELQGIESRMNQARESAAGEMRARLTQQDLDAIDEVDLTTGRVTRPEQTPDTLDRIKHNIDRHFTGRPSNLRQKLDPESMANRYSNFKTALKRIALDAAAEGTPMGAIRAAVAKAMMDSAHLTGVVIRMLDRAKTGNMLGSYKLANDLVEIYVGAHQSEADLQATVLHEGLHAFTSKLWKTVQYSPESVSQPQRDAIAGLTNLMGLAQKAGLTWQQSTGEPGVAFDEFVAAAMSDTQFQEKLKALPFERDFGTSKATNIYQAVVQTLARVMSSMVDGFHKLFGLDGPAKQNALDASAAFVTSLIANHQRVASEALDSTVKPEGDTRYRFVDGTLGTGTELTVDHSPDAADAAQDGRRMMAVQNFIQETMTELVRLWEKMGGNRSSSGGLLLTVDQAVKNLILDIVKKSGPLPSEARAAINQALVAQGVAPISESLMIGDLEQRSEGPKAARSTLEALYKIRFNLREQQRIAEDLFGKQKVLDEISTTSIDIREATKNYEDMTFVGKELRKEFRRSIDESEDVGAGSIAQKMGMTDGRKKAIAIAETWVKSNLAAFSDSMVALAELGIDLRNTPPQDVLKQVQVSAVAQPDLATFNDVGRLALAVQFARRRPIVMELLATRKSGEASALRSIINMAMSDRPDAIELAKKDLYKLQRIGAQAERIINHLRETKAENRRLIDEAKLAQEREDFAISAEPALASRIHRLERMLQIEGATSTGQQWEAHHNATYNVPTSVTQAEDQLFTDNPKSETYRILKTGPDFDGAQVQKDAATMKAWLDAHPSLKGTANYELMVRQIDGLTKIYSRELDANVKRGPSGLLMRFMSSTVDRLDRLGVLPAKHMGIMIRQYANGFDQNLKSVAGSPYHDVDMLLRKCWNLTNLHPNEFKRQYYNRALGFLENRQDLLNPSLSPEQQTDLSIAEAIKFLERTDPMSAELKTAFGKLLRVSSENSAELFKHAEKLGLKVHDRIPDPLMKDGRVLLRAPIGHALHTAARSLHHEMSTVARNMMSAWQSTFEVGGVRENRLSAGSVAELYIADPAKLRTMVASRFSDEVWSKFVAPLVTKTGKTNFTGPEIAGMTDMAKRENLVNALVTSQEDVVKFAEVLHQLEGGDPSTLADFVGRTLATFQKYASQLIKTVDTKNLTLSEDGDPGLNFLNARQGEDYPSEWLDYKTYGFRDRTRYLRAMSQQAAFGDQQTAFIQSLGEAKAMLERFKTEYERAQVARRVGDDALYTQIMDEGGNRTARSNAQANLIELASIEKRHNALITELNGGRQTLGVFQELLGAMAGMTVNGFSTAASDTVTLFEAPFRKFGFSKEAIQFIGGSWKNIGFEVMGSLAQAFGLQMHQDAARARETAMLNRNGLADFDALTHRRGVFALHERYIQELGEELSFSAITQRYKGEQFKMGAQLVRAAAARVAKGAKVFLESGIGQAKDADQSFATLKILNPFSQVSIWMHRSVTRQWLQTVDGAISKAEIYFKAHPGAESDPNFRFTHKELGYSGRSLSGMKLDNRAWEFLREKLAESGISLEAAARKKMRGEDPLDFSQVQAAMSLAQTEILLNSSPLTRPAWTQDNLAGRLFSPLVGWSIYKTADVMKSMRGPNGKADLRFFAGAMEAMMLGVLPMTLVYAWMRDKYEEDILKKKQNIIPLNSDAWPSAILDATARMGTLGIIGDIPNTIINSATQREFSVDNRVFFINSLISILKIGNTAYHQGLSNSTYASVVRPMLQAVGGSGYLQNFDIINGMTGLDNAESRLVRRINVGNQLRVAGRMTNMEVRSSRGMATTANAVKPYVTEMVLAAYANDAQGFREAYNAALLHARQEFPDADPYEKVSAAFESQHPLKSVFSARPSTQDYQKLLQVLGPEATEVSTAIRNLNAYGAQVLTRKGGQGIKPFVGSPSVKRDYRQLLTN